MIPLRQSTGRVVRIGMFRDRLDGVTPETGITLAAADEAEVLKAGGGATSSISGNTWAAITGADGWYDLTLTSGNTDTVGELVVVVQDDSVCLPVHVYFFVMEEAAYDDLYGSGAPGIQQLAEDALDAKGLDHLVSASVTGTDIADDSIIAQLVSASTTADWDDFDNLTDSLQALADSGGGGPTAEQIADAVWDEAQAGHTSAGTFGEVATEIASILVDTGTTLDDLVDDLESRLGTPSNLGSGATIAANLVDIENQTDDIGAAGAGLTAIPWNNASWDYQVQSEVADAIVAYGLDHLVSAAVTGTDVADDSIVAFLVSSSTTADWDDYDNLTDSLQALAGGGSGLTAGAIADAVWDEASAAHTAGGSFGEVMTVTGTAWNSDWDYQVQSEVEDAIVAYGLDHLVSASVTGTDVADDSIVAFLVSKSTTADWDDFDNITDSLQAIVDASQVALDAASIADAVWDEARSGHVVSGSFGEGVLVQDLTTTAKASVNAEVDTAITDVNLDHLAGASASGSDVVDDSIIAQMVSKSATADWDDFVNTTDSLQAQADGVADNVLDEVIEGSTTLRQIQRILFAAAAGASSGFGTTSIAYQDEAGTTNRITATVDDDGNRTNIVLDKT